MNRTALEQAINAAMFDIYRKAKEEANYTASIFLKMVSTRGGLDTARTLINAAKPSDGYTALRERGRLDLTVEALVTEEKQWAVLFSEEELKRASSRLKKYDYTSQNRGVK